MTIPNIPIGGSSPVPVKWLRLDKENPRISIYAGDSEYDIIKKLNKDSDLKEIISSMAANGYLDIEPLIGMLDKDSYTILEGNRRLAALKLFNSPELAQACGITLPEIKEEYKKSLHAPVNVYRVHEREDARAFIGFKHINGPHRWDSLAKGKYATFWYRKGKTNGVTVQDIAKKIGDSHDTVKKMIKAYIVLEQAENANVFNLEDRAYEKFSFSHLYTALTRSQYCEYLGLDIEWRKADPEEYPIASNKIEHLGKVLMWLYGSKSANKLPVIRSQNPDLLQLGKVIVHPQALMRLEAGAELKVAYQELIPPAEGFSNDLALAVNYIDAALTKVNFYTGGYLNLGERLSVNAAMIYERMTAIENRLSKK